MDNQESDEQEKKTSWDDLAHKLGADAPAEPIVPKATYVKTSEPAAPRKVAEPAPRPKPSPASWDSLAANFGLEVPPPPEPAPSTRAPVQPPPKVVDQDVVREEDTSRPTARRDEERPQRRERPARRAESAEREDRPSRRSRGGRSRDDSPRERRPREERPPRPERQRRPREEAHTEDRAERREEPSEIAPSLPPEPETPPVVAPGRGVSLWHKIFGTPDQQAERITESVKSTEIDDEQRKNRRDRDEDTFDERSPVGDAGETPEVGESWHAEAAEFMIDELGDVEKRTDRDVEDESERPRRRRRGRGGRGRRPEGERSRDPSSPEPAADRGESAARESSDTESPRESRGRGRSGRTGRPRRDAPRRREEPRDNLDDDGLEEIVLDDDQDIVDECAINGDDVSVTASRGRETPSGHKSIPSWDDAIGMIVETNLSTRTDRRPAPSRGSGASRGRPRGGRRRKRPS